MQQSNSLGRILLRKSENELFGTEQLDGGVISNTSGAGRCEVSDKSLGWALVDGVQAIFSQDFIQRMYEVNLSVLMTNSSVRSTEDG